MQASLYRFKSPIVNNAHTAITTITHALQHTAVSDVTLNFNENMFPCCEDNEVNTPGKVNVSYSHHIPVFILRIVLAVF